MKRTIRKSRFNFVFLALIFACMISLCSTFVSAAPIGPSVEVLSNTTKNATVPTKVNASINDSLTPAGYIFKAALSSVQQNNRWKAYVGNVSGTLTLDDAYDKTIFEWTLSTITGEVYATRASDVVNWSGINCTWISDGNQNRAQGLTSNRTPEHNENQFLSHTNKDDNITATFAYANHSALQIGTKTIGKDECFALQTWQRNSEQTFADSDDANFTQVILYDGAFDSNDGNVVYATEIEADMVGFDATKTFDFQMILPESGASGFTGSTAYYFYVELT